MTQPTTLEPASLLVVGFGVMASAILRGALAARAIDASRVTVVDPLPDARRHAESLGCAATLSIQEALRVAPPDARVLLAVKPQLLPHVSTAAAGAFADHAILSVLAGATTQRIAVLLGSQRVVRIMPNTPAKIGLGISAIAPSAGATDADREFARRVFDAVGQTVDLDESLMDAFTAIAGSGPAFVFYLAEALTRGGVLAGFDERTADRVVRAVLRGAAGLLAADPDLAANELRRQVTSQGGTTAAAMEVLDAEAVAGAIGDAVLAARDRGRQLADPA